MFLTPKQQKNKLSHEMEIFDEKRCQNNPKTHVQLQ
jgi:hypothetical protein